MARLCLAVIIMCLAISVQAEKCLPPITDDHLKLLDDMIHAQLITSCSVQVEVIDKNKLEGYCYNRGVISQLQYLLDHLKFNTNSQYFNHTNTLSKLYTQRATDCIAEDDNIKKEDLSPCLRSIYLSPVEILDRIRKSFVIFRDIKYDQNHDCYHEYKMCKEDHYHSTKGPQCACPSPTTPIISGTTTQKSLSELSETKSTPYASVIPSSTVPLTEYMSGTGSQNPQQSSKSVEMSSVILTSIPTDAQLLTTIMDHLHATTTDRLVSGTESPNIKMDISFSGMEFTKHITESTYATSLSQTRIFESKDLSRYNTESLNTDDSHTERLSTTTAFNKDFSQITGELSSVTEPVVDELLEITELNTVSPTSVSNFQTFFESSMEPGVESSSSSIVTKMRRSVENADKTLQAYVSTHAQPVLANDDSATKPPHLTFPSTFKSLHTMSQEGEIRNLGWAASYLFSTMATTKPASTEAKMFPPVSGVQSISSGASIHPKLTAHEGGYTYNNNQQQEQNVAALKSEDRENSVAGPIHTFHLLPIPETEQHQDGRQNSNLLLVMIPSILAILFLCGLLYFMYYYRLLRRQLSREQVPELPELQPLAE